MHSLNLRTIANSLRGRSPDTAQALDLIQNSIDRLVLDLEAVIRKERGRIQLDLSTGLIQTLSDRHLDRYSSDRIQITDADIVGMAATKVTGSFTTVDSGNYTVSGTQVVGAQQSALADVAETGTAEDGTCRAKVNDILAALRAHGLIDT